MGRLTVMVTDPRHDSYAIEEAILRPAGAELVVCRCGTEEDIIAQCRSADALLLDQAPVTARAAAALTRCRVICRYGVGYDNLDTEACAQRGIWACHVPDYCAEDVSDHAVALLFACLRQTALRDRMVRQGAWNILPGRGTRVAGKVLGVLGCGRIGRRFMQKMAGFGLRETLVYDPYIPDSAALNARRTTLEEVLRESDFLSLHLPATAETRGLLCRDTLALMKPSAILINTSRGALVDDEALLEALKSGRLAAAGLDTHNREPLTARSPFCQLDCVVLTDHTAYSTAEGMRELKEKAAYSVLRVLEGGAPLYPLNHPILPAGGAV